MLNSIELDQYIENHISPEEEFLHELERETHLTCLNPRMLSGHVQGKVLYMLCKMINPKNVLELGTFTGYSAISMALALDDNARLDTIEVKDELEEIIHKYIKKSKTDHIINCHFGDANEIVNSLDVEYDLVFIDADKRQYSNYFDLVFDKVKAGGYIVADNILWSGKVVDPSDQNDPQTKGVVEFNKMVHADKRVEVVIFPFRDGMSIIRKK